MIVEGFSSQHMRSRERGETNGFNCVSPKGRGRGIYRRRRGSRENHLGEGFPKPSAAPTLDGFSPSKNVNFGKKGE